MPNAHIPLDIQDALHNFGSAANAIIQSFYETVTKEPPPILYHYTNDAGLRGILESGPFWLTDVFNLNDPSELRHGLSHAEGLLHRRAANGPPESKEFANLFTQFCSQGGTEASADYFVCSFSSSGDDLGQWRAYADNGRGYALGFDGKALEDAFMTTYRSNRTFRITYRDDQLLDLQGKIIKRMFHLISLPCGKNLEKPWHYIKELAILFTERALLAALLFKHPAYKNEREYRFLQIYREPPPEAKFRARPYSLVRYIRVRLEERRARGAQTDCRRASRRPKSVSVRDRLLAAFSR